MDSFYYFIDLILHLNTNLIAVTNKYGLLTYLLLFVLLFSETGFVVTPFVPGDSIIFVAGALATTGSLNLSVLLFVLCLSVVSADNANYQIGHLSAIPVLNKNTCGRRLNFLIFRNNFISLSTCIEYES
jgi:membrane-associated protein